MKDVKDSFCQKVSCCTRTAVVKTRLAGVEGSESASPLSKRAASWNASNIKAECLADIDNQNEATVAGNGF